MRRRTPIALALLASAALVVAACGDDDDDAADTTTTAAPATTAAANCTKDALELKTEGKLTVATGEPVFEPWMVDDDPSNGKGFESALVYALAEELGFADADVTWERTGFDEAIAPGSKTYDFNIQQYSITEDRKKVVDFSDGYYEVEQALVARPDGSVAEATSIADLKDAKLGAAIGTTSLDYIENVIQPSTKAAVFDDNAAAKAAFDANQVDGLVFDLPTAYYITAVEIPDSKIVGVLPLADQPEELGLLFEKGSPLITCVNQALAALKDDGTLAALQDEWLKLGGDIPTLSS